MRPQTFQHPEIRDENDNIIKPGAFGKNTPFCTKGNDGILDYIANDLEYLYKKGGSGGGETVSVEVGTTTTAAPGAQAKVTNGGDNSHVVLNFSIPRGEKGEKGNTGIQGPPGPAADLSQYVKRTDIFDGNMIKLPNGAKIGVE